MNSNNLFQAAFTTKMVNGMIVLSQFFTSMFHGEEAVNSFIKTSEEHGLTVHKFFTHTEALLQYGYYVGYEETYDISYLSKEEAEDVAFQLNESNIIRTHLGIG